MKKKMAVFMVTGLVAVLALAGCGGGSSSGGSAGGKEVVVKLKNTQFSPKTLEIKAGQTVKFVNEDPVDHSVWEGAVDNTSPAFKSADFSTGASFTQTFDKPGTYDIWCNTGGHGLIGMTMKVVVK